MQPPRADRKVRQQHCEVEETRECRAEKTQRGGDEDNEQLEPPKLRSRRGTVEVGVLVETNADRFSEIHPSPPPAAIRRAAILTANEGGFSWQSLPTLIRRVGPVGNCVTCAAQALRADFSCSCVRYPISLR